MSTWMLRGLVFATGMVLVRLIQGTLINIWQTSAGLISVVLLAIFLVGPIVWGLLDGRADAAEQPDPDRRKDLAMTWLLGGLSAGVLSGAVCWIIGLFYKGLYSGGLVSELTTFAAFTALLIFVLAIGGVATGRFLVDRQLAKVPVRHHGLAAGEERADTDVFAAVHAEGAAKAGGGVAQASEQQGAVATAERDAPTEVIPTAQVDEPTEVFDFGAAAERAKHANPPEKDQR